MDMELQKLLAFVLGFVLAWGIARAVNWFK